MIFILSQIDGSDLQGKVAGRLAKTSLRYLVIDPSHLDSFGSIVSNLPSSEPIDLVCVPATHAGFSTGDVKTTNKFASLVVSAIGKIPGSRNYKVYLAATNGVAYEVAGIGPDLFRIRREPTNLIPEPTYPTGSYNIIWDANLMRTREAVELVTTIPSEILGRYDTVHGPRLSECLGSAESEMASGRTSVYVFLLTHSKSGSVCLTYEEASEYLSFVAKTDAELYLPTETGWEPAELVYNDGVYTTAFKSATVNTESPLIHLL